MDWSYVAGFFDGEGSISIKNAKNKANTKFYTVCIAQKDRKILEEITEFLKQNRINSHIYSGRSAQYIYISKQSEMLKFIRRIKSFCHVKLPKIQELEYILTHKKSRFKLVSIPPEVISNMYWKENLSSLRIAERLNCSSICVRDFMVRNNIPRRTLVEAMKFVTNRPRDISGRFL